MKALLEDEDFPELEAAWSAFNDADIAVLEEMATSGDFPHGVDPWSGYRML